MDKKKKEGLRLLAGCVVDAMETLIDNGALEVPAIELSGAIITASKELKQAVENENPDIGNVVGICIPLAATTILTMINYQNEHRFPIKEEVSDVVQK